MIGDNFSPLFKVGDKVTVDFIYGTNENDYPFGFVREMQALHGTTVTITSVCGCNNSEPRIMNRYHDGYQYYIAEDDYSWSSSMFKERNKIKIRYEY